MKKQSWKRITEDEHDKILKRFEFLTSITIFDGKTLIAEAHSYNDELSEEEHDANANLIAAAPDLYEALYMMIYDDQGKEWIDSELYQDDWDMRQDKAKELGIKAIKKALGEI